MQDELTTLVNNEMRRHSPGIMSALQKAYPADISRQKQRLQEISEGALKLVRHWEKPEFLPHYFNVATIGEGENRRITYEEALQITGEEPVELGQSLYHFSNRKHPVGFEGHPAMYLTASPDFDSVESHGIEGSQPTFRHTCKVVVPSLIVCIEANDSAGRKSPVESVRNSLIDEFAFRPDTNRWYKTTKQGGIEVVKVEKISWK